MMQTRMILSSNSTSWFNLINIEGYNLNYQITIIAIKLLTTNIIDKWLVMTDSKWPMQRTICHRCQCWPSTCHRQAIQQSLKDIQKAVKGLLLMSTLGIDLVVWWFGTWLDYVFHNIWEFHHPNWRTHIFQRGRYTTNQLGIDLILILKFSHTLPLCFASQDEPSHDCMLNHFP